MDILHEIGNVLDTLFCTADGASFEDPIYLARRGPWVEDDSFIDS
jgi:hypothetical protein